MNHLQITIAITDPAQQEILIALLTELGYEGFEQQEDALLAFLPEAGFDAAALEAILQPYDLAYTTTLLAERNWNEEWEKNFTPVQVGEFCAVRAHFHPPIPGVAYQLVITPKMSFGTGHHATTFMMLQAMQNLDFSGKTVLDFGTGTGVLAILAEKLGAAGILAIDNDDWSIQNAQENIIENNCIKISLLKLANLPKDRRFDVILANINKHVLIEKMAGMEQQLEPGGVILMSGLLHEDFQDIENEAKNRQLSVSVRMTRGSWICLKMEKVQIK
ncbi:MAG TPA: 50S ribosomal protein L11 methyltransferase [Puia sp.]|jgi:ribosomal protein L11 methyltransferase|nr:50S ribosomal protein L11 methyltransferase [Puia sp.]